MRLCWILICEDYLSRLTTLRSIDCGNHVHGVLPFPTLYPQRIRFLFGGLGVHDDAELANTKRKSCRTKGKPRFHLGRSAEAYKTSMDECERPMEIDRIQISDDKDRNTDC